MTLRERLKQLIEDYSTDNLELFLREANQNYRPVKEDLNRYAEKNEDLIKETIKLGEIEFGEEKRLLVVSSLMTGDITEKSSKKKQFEIGWKILKENFYDAGIFVFHDSEGRFRFSLIVTQYSGNKRTHTPFRRYTYFVDPDKANKTFINQIGKADFSDIEHILKAFSIEAVSNDFYNAFYPTFKKIGEEVQGTTDAKLKEDFALLLVIRIIFIGFVQKRGWLGENLEFVQHFWDEYQTSSAAPNTFYKEWLSPLFFEALNSKPGHKVKYRNNHFSESTEKLLQMAPYLNGELFKHKQGFDNQELWIPDEQIGNFIEFLFQYNFTIEENTFYDEELELNPEFLGIIFERLVNKEDGAVYTPRTEVDFMCRMGLLKWLQKNTTNIETDDLYHLFFRDLGTDAEYDEHQKQGDFTTAQLTELIQLLSQVTVCDPAAGSGAFEVGMLHVLHQILENLYDRHNAPKDLPKWNDFEQKKSIIANSLYGVEVKEWAVWINQLRLWLTLFIDMPDEYKTSLQPLLPSLNFKVRRGDSLVQRIGNKLFPVQGHAQLSVAVRSKITKLKNAKVEFFFNRGGSYDELRGMENQIFRDILEEEIEEKKKELRSFNNPRAIQGSLLGPSGPSQKELEIDDKEKERLKNEITELVAQQKALADQHPLIWNIEFAEIFFDGGGFDLVIGNPPYLEKGDIEDPNCNIETSLYKSLLKESIYNEFSDFFYSDKSLKKLKHKISGQSDLSIFFYLKTLSLVNSNGIQVFICTNAWMDVDYGVLLQLFLLDYAFLDLIIDNQSKRTFSNASINTIISVIHPLNKRKSLKINSQTKFIAFKKPFENVIISENLLEIENNVSTNLSLENYRIVIKSKDSLFNSGQINNDKEGFFEKNGKYVGEKWFAKYLRAPFFYEEILKKRMTTLSNFGRIKLGITSCQNSFFYLDDNKIKNYSLTERYLEPIFKTPKESSKPFVAKKDLSLKVFLYNNEVVNKEVLKYIRGGEKEDIDKVACLRSRKLWYSLGSPEKSSVFFPYSFSTAFKTFISNEPIIADKRLVQFFPKKEFQKECCVLFFNSTLWFLILEINGSTNLGEGALVFNTKDFSNLPCLYIDQLEKHSIEILHRDQFSIFKECGIDPELGVPISEQEPDPLPDRAELDTIVFDTLELTKEERKDVYRAVCQLVWNRISKAKSV